jgi:hypothetical protein
MLIRLRLRGETFCPLRSWNFVVRVSGVVGALLSGFKGAVIFRLNMNKRPKLGNGLVQPILDRRRGDHPLISFPSPSRRDAGLKMLCVMSRHLFGIRLGAVRLSRQAALRRLRFYSIILHQVR